LEKLKRCTKPKRNKGLTLIEVAIVLIILGLLIGLGAGLLGMLIKRAKIIENKEAVDAALEALISYAAGNATRSNSTHSYTTNGKSNSLGLIPIAGATWHTSNGEGFTVAINAIGGRPPYTFTCTPPSCSGLICTCSSAGCFITGTTNISSSSSTTCFFIITASDSSPDTSRQTVSGTYYVIINPSHNGRR
jgi:prepilin-type N-terminal cleavage/methylation domain-containing protein